MGAENQDSRKGIISGIVGMGKDIVALLRDGTIFLLVVLLILFPSKFNSILVNAGFKEGNLAGFTWKANLIDSNESLEKAQVTISNLQAANDDLLKQLSEANTRLKDPELARTVTKIKDENTELKVATREVQANVSKTLELNTPLVTKVLPETTYSKSDYLVGLQTLGISDAEREKLNDKIKAEGYSLHTHSNAYEKLFRPSWFAAQSTVFYYAASAQPAAQQVATFMKSITGQEFAVKRGAGLGVDPEQKNVTIYVHYVK